VIVKIRRYSGIAKKKPLRDCPAEPPPLAARKDIP